MADDEDHDGGDHDDGNDDDHDNGNGPGNGNGHGHIPSAEGVFERYALTETGVSPMGIPGVAGGQYVATGLEHSTEGRPRYDTKTHEEMTEKRFRKMEHAAKDAPPGAAYDELNRRVVIDLRCP